MADMELISSAVCPFAQRSRLALLEKGLEFDTVDIEFVGDSFKKPQWFLDLNPNERVPILKHAGNVVYESEVLNEYLEDAFPQRPLLPADPGKRATCRIWIGYSNKDFLGGFYPVIMSLEVEKQENYKREFADLLRYMESVFAELSGGGLYWMGDDVTLLDISLYPFFERFPMLEHYRGFRMPDDCVKLKAWLEAMQGRPSVAATRESDAFHIDVYKNYATGRQRGLSAKEFAKTLD